jgi:hypothetical protein
MKSQDAPAPVEGLAGATLGDQGRAVMAAMSEGSLTPDQGATLLQAIAAQAKIIEISELEERIARLEQRK